MWKDLSMQQRADLMDIYLSHGVTSLDEMRNHYDSRNQYSEGGKIYIKPENRGKFTRLKERTGHSASWFKVHGTPAQKKMATFALNAKKWKHGYGGNLYDGTSQPTQQMNNGKVLVTNSHGDNYYIDPRQVNSTEWNLTTPEVSVTANPDDVARGRAQRWYRDFGTESNDATSVAGGRRQNSHLDEWGIEGAAKAAAWAKDHPILNTIGLGLSTIPLAVAAIPAVVGGGEFAATALANPYVDAALTSMGGAHAAQSLANGEANWMTALELAPLGRLAKPMVEAATPYYNAFKTYLQNEYPAIFDPYTSWDATLGYHGDNIFSRFVGTAGRRFGYTPKAEIPEFHRRLNITKPESFRLTDDGKFIMSSGRTGEGHEGIVNFATSEPARSHNKHKYLSGVDDFIVSPKAFEGVDFKSIQPSDTFFETPLSNTEFAVDPKYITFVSGEPTALDFARSIGMKTLSSPRLRALEADGPTFSGLLSRINNFKGAHSEHARSIGNEIQRLTSMRGAPTMQDYAHFEDMTGLNSGVVPASQWTGTNAIDLFGRESGVRGVPIFNNVAYDPATSIESIYRKAKTGEGTWEAYYDALEKMPSARQQLGLNSAQWTEATAPKITAENTATVQRQIGKTAPSGSLEETANAVERGRNALLDWIRSPFYKARLEDEPLYRVSDDVVADAGKMIEEVPIDISKTKLELDPSGMVNGVTKTRPAIQTQLPDGTTVADLNTGLDVNVASDLGKDADETALHELLHYMTANSKGSPISKAGEKIIEKGWMNPTETHFDAINIIHKNRSKGWQDYILDQNDALLPQYDSVVKMVMEEPNKAISFLEKAGKSSQEAKKAIQSLRSRYSEWYDIQEQRAYLQELFHSKIKPNLKNPNDASEIEEYLSSHPEVLENFPAYKSIQEVRPGSIKDYAKYFSAALGTIPFIPKPSKDE